MYPLKQTRDMRSTHRDPPYLGASKHLRGKGIKAGQFWHGGAALPTHPPVGGFAHRGRVGWHALPQCPSRLPRLGPLPAQPAPRRVSHPHAALTHCHTVHPGPEVYRFLLLRAPVSECWPVHSLRAWVQRSPSPARCGGVVSSKAVNK